MLDRLNLILLFIFVCSSASASGIYRWVDDKGKVHYGDRPTQSGAKSVTVKKGSAAPSTGNQSNISTESLIRGYEQRRRHKNQEAQQSAEEKQRQARYEAKCKQMIAYQKRTEGSRIYDKNADGEKVFLSDDEIDRTRAERQANIDKYCS